MNEAQKTLQEWQLYHFSVEKDYAKKILSAPKNSKERVRLFQESYQKIKEITDQYCPGLSETCHNDILVPLILQLVEKKGRVLDIGCASGSLVFALLEEGYRAKGIDISNEDIRFAKIRLKPLKRENCVEVCNFIDFKDNGGFDCIIMDNVIEHIAGDEAGDVVRKCYDLLNEKGSMIIVTPHRFSGPHDISANFLPIGSKAEGLHLKEYSVSELAQLLIDCGFEHILSLPLWPTYYPKINVNPSNWALKKSLLFENILNFFSLSKLMRLNRTIAYRIEATLFPGICIGYKNTMINRKEDLI